MATDNSNPVLVHVLRGDNVESHHRGAIAICSTDGRLLTQIGNIDRPVYPRSAIKALQAIPVIESGAARKFNFSRAELAIVCSSHNGEEFHTKTVSGILSKLGLTESDLECGSQWPRLPNDVGELHKCNSKPSQLHNNCSGKHAGILAAAKAFGFDTKGYSSADHPVQQIIRDVLMDMTGFPHDIGNNAIDGCSIPTYPVPLRALAMAFAKFGTGNGGISAIRKESCQNLLSSCMEEPFMVAGNERFCTDVMQSMRSRVFVKTGAEGVFCGTMPELGIGIALKCDDGSTRAAEAMMATIVENSLELDKDQLTTIRKYNATKVLNRNEWVVGSVTPSKEFRRLL